MNIFNPMGVRGYNPVDGSESPPPTATTITTTPRSYTSEEPTYNPPQPRTFWTDGGIGSGGAVGSEPIPPKNPGESWGDYAQRLTPGQVNQLMETNQIPASALESDQGLQQTVQKDTQAFALFLQIVSNVMNASHQASEAIARNIQG